MEKLPRVGNVKKAGKLTTYWVVGTWFDGRPWATHISTDNLARTRRVDEASPFLPRTWDTVAVCPGIWTCNCRSAS